MPKPKNKIKIDLDFAYLSLSGNYYCRKSGRTRKDSYSTIYEIEFYDLNEKRIYLASGKCNVCNDEITCFQLNDTITCQCGISSVHTDQFDPYKHEYTGDITILT